MNVIAQPGAQASVKTLQGNSSHAKAAGISLAFTAAAATGAAFLTSANLFAPALALMATMLAVAAGLTAFAVNPARRDQWLTAAGVFALAAIAASIIGDPAAILTIGQ